MEEATTACRETLRRRPDSAEAHSNLGSVLEEQGRLEEAQASLREAIRLQPDLAEPYMNLGATLKNQGRLEEALSFCRKAMELDPASDSPFSSFFYYLHYDNLCEPEAVFEEHRRWGERRRALAASAAEHTNDRSPERRLRIGYVSPDFRRHSVAFFVEPVLAAHHRDSVEVCCYSNVAQPDDVTERFRAMADHWRDIRGLPEAQVVELIRGDGIDILVDLAGHTRGSRLMVFARKPAPIQVTWCGYPATTGLASIDYRLTDALADPAGQTDHLYTEKLVRLPVPFTCYRPPADAPEVSGLPSLAHGAITFGSFNFLAKVTPRIIAAWSALLEKAPGARLVLKSAPLVDESTRRLVWERFRAQGIDPSRVELLGPVDHREHLAGLSADRHRPGHVPLPRHDHHLRGAVDGGAGGGAGRLDARIAGGSQPPGQRRAGGLGSSVPRGLRGAGGQQSAGSRAAGRTAGRTASACRGFAADRCRRLRRASGRGVSPHVAALVRRERGGRGRRGPRDKTVSRRLHIGGEIPHPDWEILDAIPGPHVDHVGNANDLSRFADGTFAALYASHVLEHFDYMGELFKTLKEWKRVLEPGGTLHLSVPDLDVLASLFLRKDQFSVDERFEIQRMMFGGHISPHDYHLVGLNAEFLTVFLRGAGFVDIRQVPELGLFVDTSTMKVGEVLISLNMVAKKPGLSS